MANFQVENIPFSILAKIEERIKRAKRVAIFAHKNPDGDSLGSTISLSLMLDKLGIDNDLICIDAPGAVFNFLPKINEFLLDFNPTDYDLAIIPDSGDLKMISFAEKYSDFFETVEQIKIDHHPNGHYKPKLSWIDPGYASVTEMLSEFFKIVKWEISPQVATCLLTGLYTDTGSFQHSNTTNHVFKTAGFLLRKGASYSLVSKNIFRTIPISTFKLWGRVLSRIEKNEEDVVFSAVTKKDYEDCNAKREQLAGAVDYLNSVKDSKYSILLTEEKDNVKASLRTKHDEIDVAKIAKEFGGGGHTKAAGFAIPGKLKAETHWRVVRNDELENIKS